MTDYAFYRDTFHGSTIPEGQWPEYAARASEQLARYERNYTVTVPAALPDGRDRAVCAMAEALYGFDLIANGEGGLVQSVSIGSVSASYSSAAAQSMDLSPKGQAQELYRCASLYLDIFRGVG